MYQRRHQPVIRQTKCIILCCCNDLTWFSQLHLFGKLWPVFTCALQELSTSPQALECLLTTTVKYLMSRHVDAFPAQVNVHRYVDDFVVTAPTFCLTSQALQVLVQGLQYHGFVIQKCKTCCPLSHWWLLVGGWILVHTWSLSPRSTISTSPRLQQV